MSYYIDIIDTSTNGSLLAYEYARAGGIVLKWHGSDTKDDMAIVASELQFQFGHNELVDAKFIALFTGDETKFKVQVKKSVDNKIIWQGHILPDLYSEPYTNGVTFTEFTATDGLGRLKGKYLSDEFYEFEKSIIEIYAEILKLTGLNLDFVFNPAIENVIQKNWNLIYIDTADFIKKDKKQDAYKILDLLLKDTLCVCYQADNVWFIEGINQRNLRKIDAKLYNANGVVQGLYVTNRLLKSITPLVEPTVTIIPPYNEIKVTHERVPQNFNKTMSKEVVDGVSIQTGVIPIVLGKDWMANGDCFARCESKDYYNSILHYGYVDGTDHIYYPANDNDFIDLKTKLFFHQNQKVVFNFKFKIMKTFERPYLPTSWPNDILKYEITLNGDVLFSNFGTPIKPIKPLVFGTSETAELDIDYIFETSGIINVKLYRPYGRVNDSKVRGFTINEAKIEIKEFEETLIETDLINGDFTVDKEVELTYADDQSGFSKGFRLFKLKDDNTLSYNELTYTVAYQFTFNGRFYAVISVEAAILIKQNLKNVTYYNPPTHTFIHLPILSVSLNFNRGEQMVIETPFALPQLTNNPVLIKVKKYRIIDVLGDRDKWLQWTDAVYKIEDKRYLKTVANIYRRMFSLAHEKIELTCKNAIKFNDYVWFKYVNNKTFQMLNCTWNLDENKSSLVIARTMYRDSGTNPNDENLPPIVLSESPIYITDLQNVVNLTATAYDPDGFIVGQNWTKLNGIAGDAIVTPTQLNTTINGLTGNYYKYRITATDNDGATGFADVEIIRRVDYMLDIDLVADYYSGNQGSSTSNGYGTLSFTVTPDFTVSTVLNITGRIVFEFYGEDTYMQPLYGYQIFKNGVLIEENVSNTVEPASFVNFYNFNIAYVLGDVILIVATGNQSGGQTGELTARVFFDSYSFVQGYGVIINIPSSYYLYDIILIS